MTEAASRGRPMKATAKRRDPNMQPSTVYLRKDTKCDVQCILIGKPMDLSDLCNQLLAQWVQQQHALDPSLKIERNVHRLREVE